MPLPSICEDAFLVKGSSISSAWRLLRRQHMQQHMAARASSTAPTTQGMTIAIRGTLVWPLPLLLVPLLGLAPSDSSEDDTSGDV